MSIFVHLADGIGIERDANVAALKSALPDLQVIPTVAQQRLPFLMGLTWINKDHYIYIHTYIIIHIYVSQRYFLGFLGGVPPRDQRDPQSSPLFPNKNPRVPSYPLSLDPSLPQDASKYFQCNIYDMRSPESFVMKFS